MAELGRRLSLPHHPVVDVGGLLTTLTATGRPMRRSSAR